MACGSPHTQRASQQSVDDHSPAFSAAPGTYATGTLCICQRCALGCPSPLSFAKALGLWWRLNFPTDLPVAREERGAAAWRRFSFHKSSQFGWDFHRWAGLIAAAPDVARASEGRKGPLAMLEPAGTAQKTTVGTRWMHPVSSTYHCSPGAHQALMCWSAKNYLGAKQRLHTARISECSSGFAEPLTPLRVQGSAVALPWQRSLP